MAAHNPRLSDSGFTIVELALVMVIIGLLGGAALKAQEMIANARMSSTVTQVQSYQRAVGIFHDSYLAIPGDFNAAQLCLKNCAAADSCFNGNGDGAVGANADAWQDVDVAINSENAQLWRHLALSDLIDGVLVVGSQTGFGLSQPVARPAAGFFARQANAAAGLPDGLVLVLRAGATGQWESGGSKAMALAPKDAAKIDRKIDDGYAFSGYAYAVSDGRSDGCGDANAGSNGQDGYDEASVVRSCDMIFKLWPAPL